MSEEILNVLIDGEKLKLKKGDNLLRALTLNGLKIGDLCFHKELSSTGNCGQCLLEDSRTGEVIKGCLETVREGLDLLTSTPEITQQKSLNYDLLLFDHPDSCRECFSNTNCSLQNNYPDGASFQTLKKKRKEVKIEQIVDKFFMRENFCIGCDLCVLYSRNFTKKNCFSLDDQKRITFRGSLNLDYHHSLVDLCPSGVFVSESSQNLAYLETDKLGQALCLECPVNCKIQVYHSSAKEEFKIKGVDILCNQGRSHSLTSLSNLKKIKKNPHFEKLKKRPKVILSPELLEEEISAVLSFLYSENIENCFFRPFVKLEDGLKREDLNVGPIGPYSLIGGLSVTIETGQYESFTERLKPHDYIIFVLPEAQNLAKKWEREVEKMRQKHKVLTLGATELADLRVKSFFTKQGQVGKGERRVDISPLIDDPSPELIQILKELI